MPVKRRTRKRRYGADREIAVWGSIFDTGYDFFNEMPSIDLQAGPDGHPLPEDAADAWARLGADYMAASYLRPQVEMEQAGVWAIEQFGDPLHSHQQENDQ